MGQPIDIEHVTRLGDVAIFDTDRSLTGQLGEAFDSVEATEQRDDFAAALAGRLFEADPAIDHVYVAMNDVIVRRSGGWDDAAVATIGSLIRDLFRFYPSEPSS